MNRSDRTYNSYLLLLRLVPRLKEILEDATVDSNMFNQFITQAGFLVSFQFLINVDVVQLQKGANDGRSDDIRRVKEEVTVWINQSFSPSIPLNPKNRDNRGFQNDFTGRLLCPIEYSWDDLEYVIMTGLFHILVDDFCAVSVPRSATVNLIYQKTTFLHVFTRRDTEIQMTLKNIFFGVVFLLRLFFLVFEIDF